MSTMTLEERFEQFEDETLDFSDIAKPLHRRADICAFLMLDSLCPPADKGHDMVAYAEHDAIHLDVDLATLEDNITDDQIRDLMRCGVVYDGETDGLIMYV